jgi:hypothetical protein
MNKISFLVFGTVFICLNFSCNPHNDYALKFEIDNNSDSSVYFTINASYPDSSLRSIKETTPWDSIVKHYVVLKRYQLTKSDMEKSNWTITYP